VNLAAEVFWRKVESVKYQPLWKSKVDIEPAEIEKSAEPSPTRVSRASITAYSVR
jgi:hypothetical protein